MASLVLRKHLEALTEFYAGKEGVGVDSQQALEMVLMAPKGIPDSIYLRINASRDMQAMKIILDPLLYYPPFSSRQVATCGLDLTALAESALEGTAPSFQGLKLLSFKRVLDVVQSGVQRLLQVFKLGPLFTPQVEHGAARDF